jgi:hypothetical protein
VGDVVIGIFLSLPPPDIPGCLCMVPGSRSFGFSSAAAGILWHFLYSIGNFLYFFQNVSPFEAERSKRASKNPSARLPFSVDDEFGAGKLV